VQRQPANKKVGVFSLTQWSEQKCNGYELGSNWIDIL